MIWSTLGYNSLNYLMLHYKVWSTDMSKYKLIRIGQPGQLIQVKSFKARALWKICFVTQQAILAYNMYKPLVNKVYLFIYLSTFLANLVT